MRTYAGAVLRAGPPGRRSGASFRDLRGPGCSRPDRGQHWEAMGPAGRGAAPALKCQVCNEGEAIEGETCPYCGATVRCVFGRGAPLPAAVLAEVVEERRARKLGHEAHVRERSQRHAVIGALIFALCGCGLLGATLCALVFHDIIEKPAKAGVALDSPASAEGAAPATHLPFGLVLRLMLAFPLAAILGAPAGYATSRLERGPGFGALVGAAAFGLATVLLNLGSIVGSSRPWLELALSMGLGLVPGVCVGFLLGRHVSSDE